MPETETDKRDDPDTAASRARELVQEAAQRVSRDEAYSEKKGTATPQVPPAPNGTYRQRYDR